MLLWILQGSCMHICDNYDFSKVSHKIIRGHGGPFVHVQLGMNMGWRKLFYSISTGCSMFETQCSCARVGPFFFVFLSCSALFLDIVLSLVPLYSNLVIKACVYEASPDLMGLWWRTLCNYVTLHKPFQYWQIYFTCCCLLVITTSCDKLVYDTCPRHCWQHNSTWRAQNVISI